MKRLKKYKKAIWLAGCIFLVWFFVQSAILVVLGNVDYTLTFQTNYEKEKDDSINISTSWANIRMYKRLIHIAKEPICPGYVGTFITTEDLLNYEYNMFSPGLGQFLETGYHYKTDTLNNRIIHTIIGEDNLGFIVPWQEDMSYSLILFPSNYATKNQEMLLEALANIEFLK